MNASFAWANCVRPYRARGFSRVVATAFFGALVLAAGCSDNDNNGGEGGSAAFGTTLTINARVYWDDSHWSGNSWREVYNPYNGSATGVIAQDWYWGGDLGGSGSITSGQFNFTLSTPDHLWEAEEYFEYFFDGHDDINISDRGANVAMFSYLSFNEWRGELYRDRWVVTRNTDSEFAGFSEHVRYIYVDRDVTVSGRGETDTYSGSGYSNSYTTRSFTFNLKEGWNAVYERRDWTETESNDFYTYDETQTALSLSNPSNIRWIIWENFDWDATPSLPPATHTPLTGGQWKDGTFTSRTAHWYSFSVTEGTTYYIWDNDMYGDGTKTADIMADVWYADGTRAHYPFDDHYDYPASFTASQSGTVYVRVYPIYNIGTYSITYTTSQTRPMSKEVSASLYKRSGDGGDLKKKTRRHGTFRDAKNGFVK